MLAPPPDLDVTVLMQALEDGWGISNPDLGYLAVGFGSHHWRAATTARDRWFVTVDAHAHSATIDALRRAFSTAIALRYDAGLPFVLAPLPDEAGDPIHVVQDGRFTVAVTPWIDAVRLGKDEFSSVEDRAAVLALLKRLHAVAPSIGSALPPVDLRLPRADHLHAALERIHVPWTSGPFAEPARALLLVDLYRLTTALARYDELAAMVRDDESIPWVVTHGEPHQANVLRNGDGALHMIDWDTARLAPRERDLWMVLDDTGDLAGYEQHAAAPQVSSLALRLFRMRWDLSEIATYVSLVHAPHRDDPNTRECWRDLQHYLPVIEDHLAPVNA